MPLRTFLYDKGYLALPRLSDEQEHLVATMSQIYKKETLYKIWEKEEADRLWGSTYNEIIAQLGKGSGKDFCSTVGFSRVAYLLLCLKDPAAYYGKPSGDSIHMLNVAVNAKQAQNVFFEPFKDRIKACPWFAGKFDSKADRIEFDKNITAHSGHSEREAWEGYNLLMVVLDEIAGFASAEELSGTQSSRGKTADAIYNMYSASVSSRFPQYGKTVLLSFPRFKGDFIQQRYDKVVADKEVKEFTHTFKIHDELPEGPDNEFTVEWVEDRIVSYHEPNVFAMKKPTWKVNPTVTLDSLKREFMKNPEDALARFACMPPDAVDAFFKDKEKIRVAFPPGAPGPFHADWSFKDTFEIDKEKDYYAHVDLGYKHDRAAVAVAHVSDWKLISYGGNWEHYAPQVSLDLVRYWTPTSTENVDFSAVEDFILLTRRMGFNLKLVTFDRWNSISTMQSLKNYGIRTDTLSVAKQHYEDMSLAIVEERVKGYDIPILREELVQLRIIRGNKVDHPRKGSKDVSDAVVGAVYNAIAHSRRDANREIEISYMSPSEKREKNEVPIEETKPKQPMPPDLSDFLDRARLV